MNNKPFYLELYDFIVLNKGFWLLPIIFLLVLFPLVSASNFNDSVLSNGFLQWLPLNNDVLDSSGQGNDGTAYGGVSYASCLASTCIDFDGSADYVDIGQVIQGKDPISWGVWVNLDTISTDCKVFGAYPTNTNSRNFMSVEADGGAIVFMGDGTHVSLPLIATSANDYTSGWFLISSIDDGTNQKLYVGTTEVATASSSTLTGRELGGRPMFLGAYNLQSGGGASGFCNGLIDEFWIYNGTLSTAGLTEIYNQVSAGNSYNYSYTPTPSSPFASVRVFDKYDNSSLSGLTVYIGTDSNTTDGTGKAIIYNPTGFNYTIDGGSLYFNASGTAIENATVQKQIVGAFPDITAYDVEGNNVLAFNLTSSETSNTTSDGSAELLLPPNATTLVSVTSAGFYALSQNITTTGQDVSNKNVTGLYQTLLTINATNAYTGLGLSNFSGWVYNNETGFNVSFNDSGTGNATVNVLNGLHTIYIDVFDYSISSANFDSSNYTDTTYNKTFSLYSENSIFINIYSETDSSYITANVTVVVTGNSTETIYNTISGTLFIENLTDGNYSIKLSATNYTQRTYTVTVADRSAQTLNAFLSASTDIVTFSLSDFDTSQSIEGASMIQQRLINSTWTTVESKTSDITGRAQFTYTIGVKYRFTVTHPDYTTKVFDLDPVIFTSYNIRLQKDLTLDKEIGLFDVTITYYPFVYTNEENNTFTITFGSVGGSLETYGYNLTYPTGTLQGTGTNANGGTFSNSSFLITGATYGDYVTLTYWYQSTLGENKTYVREFVIDGAANEQTIYNNVNDGYGLGTLEKILIAVIVTIVFAGIVTLYGSSIAGLLAGAIFLGLFTYIGFLSIWITIPTFLVAVLIMVSKGVQ